VIPAARSEHDMQLFAQAADLTQELLPILAQAALAGRFAVALPQRRMLRACLWAQVINIRLGFA
jgi:hypothetical protein